VKGYPVRTTTAITIMGKRMKSITELVEYDSHRSVPRGFYDVPKGYTKEEVSSGEEGRELSELLGGLSGLFGGEDKTA
jgi:hypothetical protein